MEVTMEHKDVNDEVQSENYENVAEINNPPSAARVLLVYQDGSKETVRHGTLVRAKE